MNVQRLHSTVWRWQQGFAEGAVWLDLPRHLVLITAEPITLEGEENPLPPVRGLHHPQVETPNPWHIRVHALFDSLVHEYRWRNNPADQLYRSILDTVAIEVAEAARDRFEDLRIWAEKKDPHFPEISRPHEYDSGCPICTRGHEVVAYLLDLVEPEEERC